MIVHYHGTRCEFASRFAQQRGSWKSSNNCQAVQAIIAGLYHIEPDYQQEGHMADTRYYSIGELAELCSVSSKSLRYYDTIGLLSPEHKNDDTGYRYYTKQQVFDVFLIKKLQNLGFSLKEIQDIIKIEDPKIFADEVGHKMDELRKQIDQMERIYAEGISFVDKLNSSRQGLELFDGIENDRSPSEYNDKTDKSDIHIENVPQITVLYTRKHMTNYNNTEISVRRWFELFKLAEHHSLPVSGSIILTYHTDNSMEQFYKTSCELEAMLPVKCDNSENYPDIKLFGGFKAATALHVGTYETISATHLRLLKWIESQGLKLNGKISEEYLISPVDFSVKQNYITRVIAPIT